ncbi:MAG: hypothetical protein ACFB4J_16995 [Elainellaceae cyanobacterium]
MEPLTAAAIATLLLTKMVEKLGETIGEKIPDLGATVWEKVTSLKSTLTAKSPETAALLQGAEAAPILMDSQPELFGLPALTEELEAAAKANADVKTLVEAIASEVRPQLPAEVQKKVVDQVLLKGVKTRKSIRATRLTQEADASADKVRQEMLVDVETKGDIDLGDVSQKA